MKKPPMHPSVVPVLILALACASCDKARQIADKATSELKDKIAAGGTGAQPVDPALAELVDESPDGVVFRKDLPFPERIEVQVRHRAEWSGRLFSQSEFQPRSQAIQGTRSSNWKLTRVGDEVRHTPGQNSFTIPSPDDPEATPQSLADPFGLSSPAKQSLVLRMRNGTWGADPADGFRSAAIAKDLGPVFQDLLIENGLAPRRMWFAANKRFKPGERLTVAGDSLPMLVAGKANGGLELVFEGLEPVAGHPCAVFAVSGDFSRSRFPDFDGHFSDEEITIQSGRLWLSLIHPLILREELDTIQSVKTGPAGSPAAHGQGAVKVSVTRDWIGL